MATLQTPKNRSSPEKMSSRYRLFRALMRLLGRIFLGFAVHGEENMPPKGAVVVAAWPLDSTSAASAPSSAAILASTAVTVGFAYRE